MLLLSGFIVMVLSGFTPPRAQTLSVETHLLGVFALGFWGMFLPHLLDTSKSLAYWAIFFISGPSLTLGWRYTSIGGIVLVGPVALVFLALRLALAALVGSVAAPIVGLRNAFEWLRTVRIKAEWLQADE